MAEMSGFGTSFRRRGTELLLVHCTALCRPPAADRLSAELGGDFSRRLVAALARGQGVERRRRGSSSPYSLT
jgi:hypothetical protein